MGRAYESGPCAHWRFLSTIVDDGKGYRETEWCPACDQILDVQFIPKGPSPKKRNEEHEKRRIRMRRQYGG